MRSAWLSRWSAEQRGRDGSLPPEFRHAFIGVNLCRVDRCPTQHAGAITDRLDQQRRIERHKKLGRIGDSQRMDGKFQAVVHRRQMIMPPSRLVLFLSILFLAASLRAAHAGPPYVTDDPEPTETHQFENYLYVQGTHAAGSSSDPGVGIEINYGAFANTQFSLSVPLNPNPGPGGIGLVWAPLGGGIKYRFIQEDSEGWRPQVAVFPQIFIPVGSASHTGSTTELLPLWLQKSFGPWTAFGGGGYTRNPGQGNKNFVIYGGALQRQISDKLQLGLEFFGQTHDTAEGHGTTAAGFAALYDLDNTWHLIGSVNTSIAGARDSDRFSCNLALKWTH